MPSCRFEPCSDSFTKWIERSWPSDLTGSSSESLDLFFSTSSPSDLEPFGEDVVRRRSDFLLTTIGATILLRLVSCLECPHLDTDARSWGSRPTQHLNYPRTPPPPHLRHLPPHLHRRSFLPDVASRASLSCAWRLLLPNLNNPLHLPPLRPLPPPQILTRAAVGGDGDNVDGRGPPYLGRGVSSSWSLSRSTLVPCRPSSSLSPVEVTRPALPLEAALSSFLVSVE